MASDTVTGPPDLAPEVRAYLERVVELYRTHDVDRMVALFVTEDCGFYDHRPLGAEPVVGREAIAEWTRNMFALLPDWRLGVTVLAQRGDVYLARDTYQGADEHGGEAMVEWYVVDRLRDGLLEREDMYEDEASARAAYQAALVGTGPAL